MSVLLIVLICVALYIFSMIRNSFSWLRPQPAVRPTMPEMSEPEESSSDVPARSFLGLLPLELKSKVLFTSGS